MTWHMLKTRESGQVLTRCGETIRLRTGQYLPDIKVTGSEDRVTCPNCALPRRCPP